MATHTSAGEAPRSPLTRQRVLHAAMTFADEHGIETLSMRKLAAELGFGVMSLYNHVTNKDDLLDGIVDLVASEIEPPTGGADWRAAMRASAISAHRVLLAHPWASSRWSSGWPGPARLNYMESLLKGLREAGFSAEMTYYGFHALNQHILGFTLQELNFAFDDEELGELATKFFREVPTDSFPYLTEHAMAHLDASSGGDDEFEFVLDLILDGLDNVRHTR